MSDFLPFSRPAMGDEEINAACEVLRSGWITTGPRNQELEQAFCDRFGAQHAIAVSSATGGMHVTLMALGIGPGDEVITPSQTWVSTINLITLLGAKPVFVDVDRDTLMTDASRIEAAINPDTRAIIPVHYAGAPWIWTPSMRWPTDMASPWWRMPPMRSALAIEIAGLVPRAPPSSPFMPSRTSPAPRGAWWSQITRSWPNAFAA